MSIATRTTGQRWVLAVTATAEFMAALDVLVVTTALGTIRRDLDASVGSLEWTLTAYNVCLAGCMMVAAALGERFGRRRTLVAGILGFTLGSAVSAASPSIGWLIGGRVVQGVGAALMAPLALPLISAVYPPERRGRTVGIVVGVAGLATFAGPLIGGGLAQGFGWQWIFWVNVPIGLALAALAHTRIPESRGAAVSIDATGLCLVTAALASLAWGLVRAASESWGAADVLAGLALGVLLAGGFIVWERRASRPLLELSLFRSAAFNATNAATVCHSAIVLGAVFVMAQFLQAGLGLGAFAAGVALLPWTGTMVVVAPLAGRAADRLGSRAVMVAGLATAAAGYGSLAVIAHPGVAYAALVLPLLATGIGNSAVFPATSAAIAAAVPAGQLGSASGVNIAIREIGGILGIAAVALAFNAAGSFHGSGAVFHGFRAAIGLCAVTGLAGAGLAALAPARPSATCSASPGRHPDPVFNRQ